jgi:hypothetical protein
VNQITAILIAAGVGLNHRLQFLEVCVEVIKKL